MRGIASKMRINRKSPLRHRFAFRLALSYGAVFTLVFVTAGFYLTRYFETQTLERLKDSLLSQARLLTHVITPERVQTGDGSEIQKISVQIADGIPARMTIVNREGQVLGDSKSSEISLEDKENLSARPEISKALSGISYSNIAYSKILGADILYAAVPFEQDGNVTGALRLALPLKDVQAALKGVRQPVLIAAAAGIGLVFVLGFWLGRQMSRRISFMTKAALRYARGDLSQKILIDGRDELKTLGDSMNKMEIGRAHV